MMVMKADTFQPQSTFEKQATELAERTRNIPPAGGFDVVLVPGDPEKRTRVIRSREGIPVEDDIWESVVRAAKSVGVTV